MRHPNSEKWVRSKLIIIYNCRSIVTIGQPNKKALKLPKNVIEILAFSLQKKIFICCLVVPAQYLASNEINKKCSENVDEGRNHISSTFQLVDCRVGQLQQGQFEKLLDEVGNQ